MPAEPDATPTNPQDNPHENTPGHPDARGTLPMARRLTDPAIEEEIQALARTALRMTVDQAIRIARLVGWNDRPTNHDNEGTNIGKDRETDRSIERRTGRHTDRVA
jgi:hypothetical protein